jgi:hypothetical protein
MLDSKDVAVAVLGASLGLAALLLVPIGFLLAHAASFPAGTPEDVERRFRFAAKCGLAPTAAAVIEALACYSWLIWRNDYLLYVWAVGFVVVAVGFLVYAIVSVLMV